VFSVSVGSSPSLGGVAGTPAFSRRSSSALIPAWIFCCFGFKVGFGFHFRLRRFDFLGGSLGIGIAGLGDGLFVARHEAETDRDHQHDSLLLHFQAPFVELPDSLPRSGSGNSSVRIQSTV
jgi:hypothetical protein